MPEKPLPRVDHWPDTLKSASVLLGTLARCGPGYRPVGWPETPVVRSTALATFLESRFVAIEDTAAWIWGACRSPGHPIRVSTRRGRAPYATGDDVDFHEFRFEAGEFTCLGVCAVTTPHRTAYDILRSSDPFTLSRRTTCRLLLMHDANGAEAVRARAGRSNRVDRARVSERLEACYGR